MANTKNQLLIKFPTYFRTYRELLLNALIMYKQGSYLLAFVDRMPYKTTLGMMQTAGLKL